MELLNLAKYADRIMAGPTRPLTAWDILAVIRDGSRADRYLKMGQCGPYLTADRGKNHLEDYIYVPCGMDTTEEDEEADAQCLLARVMDMDQE